MRQLVHNGVLIPRYEPKGFHLWVKGKDVGLTPRQEEMAVAWVKKIMAGQILDKVLVRNFFKDFCTAMEARQKLGPEDFDFSDIELYINQEKALKLSLTREERKRTREQRKAAKEANRQKYGYALVDGVKTEISNFAAEPSCIFAGRGRHPLRGRWKEGPTEEDTELNLSLDAAKPPGNWKAFLWLPDVMWIARWRDKLTGKTRYVWLSESSQVKQKKEIGKFDKAEELRRNLSRIQSHIGDNLDADDLRRKKTAMVCYLIDRLKIRVGDEKDPDEADTVGASTLRPEHIGFEEDGGVTFNFLGKNSIPHIFRVELPPNVIKNLKDLSADATSTLFSGVDSERVSEFLGEVLSGLSAKVFRTCYASEAVENALKSVPLRADAPDYAKKHVATMANLEAAKVCNHRRIVSTTWKSSLRRRETHLRELVHRATEAQKTTMREIREKEEQFRDRLRKQYGRLEATKQKMEKHQREAAERRQEGKPFAALGRRIRVAQGTIRRQKDRIGSMKRKHDERRRNLRERLEKRRQRHESAIRKMSLQIEARKETRDYNLGTSLKSYIDPRIYYRWGKEVNYDWRLYYPKALQKKFSWVETEATELA